MSTVRATSYGAYFVEESEDKAGALQEDSGGSLPDSSKEWPYLLCTCLFQTFFLRGKS